MNHIGQDGKWKELQAMVSQTMEERSVPGVAVGLWHDGEMATTAFGITSVENPLPVTEGTLFQIGSITKTFTGTLVMRLVEQSKLDLDAPVRTYLPDFRVADADASARVTLHHLLTHTGGWDGDLFLDTGAGDDALAKYVAAMADSVQLAPLGTLYSYCNSGFSVAGRIIEVVTGKCYQDALREMLLEPLGLKRSYLDPSDVMTHRFAVGHYGQGKQVNVARPWRLSRSAYPAGGIVCDIPDLLRYARFHLGDGTSEAGTRLLEPASLAAMRTPQVKVWGEAAQWGLPWSINISDGVRLLSHGGGTNGQVSLLLLVPERQLALAVFTNSGAGGGVTSQVRRWVLKTYLGLESPEPQPIESSVAELQPYIGLYTSPSAEGEIGMLAGQLVMQTVQKFGFPDHNTPPPPPPPPVRLALCEPDRLLMLDGPSRGSTIDVLRRPDGQIGWMRSGGRLYRRVS